MSKFYLNKEVFEAYFQTSLDYYKKAFNFEDSENESEYKQVKDSINGKMSIVAIFFTFEIYLYRKLYLAAFITLIVRLGIIFMVEDFSIMMGLLPGIVGSIIFNGLVHNRYLKTVENIDKLDIPFDEKIMLVKKKGGTNIYLAIGFFLASFIFAVYVLMLMNSRGNYYYYY